MESDEGETGRFMIFLSLKKEQPPSLDFEVELD